VSGASTRAIELGLTSLGRLGTLLAARRDVFPIPVALATKSEKEAEASEQPEQKSCSGRDLSRVRLDHVATFVTAQSTAITARSMHTATRLSMPLYFPLSSTALATSLSAHLRTRFCLCNT
jgi:hypothetical protein